MKAFTINNSEYTLQPCTAICGADLGNEEKRQNAVLVSSEENGEKFQNVVFGWSFDEISDIDDFNSMCEDSSAWESDYEVLETVRVM